MQRWLPVAILCGLLPLTAVQAAYDDYDDIHTYVSGGLHHWTAGDSSAEGLKFRLGQQLSTFVAAEVHFAAGGEDTDSETSLERLFGLYGRFSLPLDRFTPYFKLGIASASLSVAGDTSSEFEMGYGLGAEFSVSERFFIDLEYMKYMETTALELDGFTLGIGYRLP